MVVRLYVLFDCLIKFKTLFDCLIQFKTFYRNKYLIPFCLNFGLHNCYLILFCRTTKGIFFLSCEK